MLVCEAEREHLPRGKLVEVDGVRLHHSSGGDRSVRAALPAP